MKFSRIRKLTIRIVLIYTSIVLLWIFAKPDFNKLEFIIPACTLIFLGQLIRFWATGHLVKNKILTTSGPYNYVKNPLYLGTFFIMVGFCLIAQGELYINWILLAIGCSVFIFYYAPYKKKREGDRLRKIYGQDWDLYDQSIPDYFPTFRKYGKSDRQWNFMATIENSEQWTCLAVIAGILSMYYHEPIARIYTG